MRLYISPRYEGPDKAHGGIRRVVEAQLKWLPTYDVEIVDNILAAEVVAFHAGIWEEAQTGVPVVAHTHGVYWEEYPWNASWYTEVNKDVIRTLKNADEATAPSQWVADAMRRGMWLNPHVIYHGIEPEDWPERTSPEDGYILWNKARVDPVCDPAPVNELAKRVTDQNFVTTFGVQTPNVYVTGSVPYEKACEDVRRAGVYLATTRETFGIGTLEAMAAGVPVLGFAFGGQPEIVVHKQHGYLARPGDYEDLEVGLRYIRKHHKYLSHAARQFVLEQFTWQQMIRRYAEVYHRLLARKRNSVKVSVVITNYNLGKYLPDAITSAEKAVDMLGMDSEIVVIDDASTEPLPEQVITNTNIRLIRNPENLYLAESLNKAIDVATGEYILPLDADNLLDVRALQTLVGQLDRDRGLDIAYGKMEVFTDDPNQRPFVSEWPPSQASLREQLQHKNQITSTALYRRKVWERIGGYRRRCHTAEDADFWCRALACGFSGKQVTEAVTLRYRDRAEGMSRTQKDWAWNAWYQWAGPTSDNRSWTTGGAIHIHDAPLVSVVIPVGPGHERYLLDALDSVQAQSGTFWNWEAVVVNDTGKRLPWVHPWARVVNGEGKGVSHARNIGKHFARGDYLLYLDSDDYLHPDALYHMYNVAVSSNCPRVFVYSDWWSAEDRQAHDVTNFDPKDLLNRLPFPVTCLYKKSDLDGIKFDESFTNGWEDWDYAIQVVSKGICGLHISSPLLHYRLDTGTLRKDASANSEQIRLKLRDKWSSLIEDKGLENMPGCGGCGGGRYPAITEQIQDQSVFSTADLEAETTTIQYNAPEDWTSTRTFLGRVTGNRYRFSPDAEGRIQRVYNADVPGLIEMGFFELVQFSVGDVEPLQADGPPGATA